MKNWKNALAALGIAGVVGMAAIGCGSDHPAQVAGGDYQDFTTSAQDATCLPDLSDASAQEYKNKARQDGDIVTADVKNDDGTSQVCVLEGDGNGGYREHYYGRNDGFADYAFALMLMNRYSNPATGLVTIGMLEGDISPMDAWLLTNMYSTNPYGQVYHPYSRYDNGTFGHQPSVPPRVNNTYITVNQVSYGAGSHQQTRSYKDSLSSPPAGYTKPKVMPPTQDRVAKLSGDVKKPPTVEPGKKASSTIGTKPTVKSAPAPSVKNTAPKPTSSSAPKATSAPKPTSKPAAPKPTSKPKPSTTKKSK